MDDDAVQNQNNSPKNLFLFFLPYIFGHQFSSIWKVGDFSTRYLLLIYSLSINAIKVEIIEKNKDSRLEFMY